MKLFWINHLERVKKSSDDPDTQTAAIIVDESDDFVVAAANEMPVDLERKPSRLQRPEKYSYIGHAERTAICRAARNGYNLEGTTMYLNWFPCCDCALAIVESGISVLYCDQKAYEARKDDPRYGFDKSMEILIECGVQVEWF
jgi:dCMP deaminase